MLETRSFSLQADGSGNLGCWPTVVVSVGEELGPCACVELSGIASTFAMPIDIRSSMRS